ncbi:MAG: hypothetical protein R6U88_01725 [Candidatus Bipolaricaulota bacterium]
MMGTAQEAVLRMLADIPDDASLEDIQYSIYVRQKVVRGLRDVKEGQVLTPQEDERRNPS